MGRVRSGESEERATDKRLSPELVLGKVIPRTIQLGMERIVININNEVAQ